MIRYSHAVLVGRFQPFHKAHQKLFNQAKDLADRVIVVIGSAQSAPSLKNPWSVLERELMIKASVESTEYITIGIQDSAYNLSQWKAQVQTAVYQAAGYDSRIILVGHEKDATSSYLGLFPEWNLQEVPATHDGLSATEIRTALFESKIGDLSETVTPAVLAFLENWLTGPIGSNLVEEYKVVQAYRETWSAAPYPPTLVTTDAMVICQSQVLVIRRGRHPGKGLLALPGGFLEPDESIRAGIIRELLEETALSLSVNKLQTLIREIAVFDRTDRDPRGRLISHVGLLVLDDSLIPLVSAADDAQEAFWLPIHEALAAPERFFSDHAHIIRWFIGRQP